MNSTPNGVGTDPQPAGDRLAGRVTERVFLTAGVLLALVSFRLDAAVRTAYDTDWTSSVVAVSSHSGGPDALLTCEAGSCARLPSDPYLVAYVAIWSFAAGFLLAAVLRWLARRSHDVSPGSRRVVLWATLVAMSGAALGAVFRWSAAGGHGGGQLGVAALGTVVTLAAALFAALVLANVLLRTDFERDRIRTRLARIVRRQRLNLIAVVAYVLLLLVFGQTSGQALDALRSWDLSTWRSASWAAFGVASTVLLALAVYESAVRLNEPQPPIRSRRPVPARRWLLFGIVTLALGGVSLALWQGSGILILGGLLLGLAGAEALRPAETGSIATKEPAVACVGGRSHLEVLAIAPLVAVAGGIAISAVDAVLTPEVVPGVLWSLLPGAVLLAAAVLMTQRDANLALDVARRPVRALLGALLLILGVGFVLAVQADSTEVSTLVGVASAAMLLAYAVFVFRIAGGRHSYGLALPLALAVAMALLLGIHLDVHGTAGVLGTLAIVNVALAGFVALLYYLAQAVLVHQPPRLFAWFGMRQLPLVSLLLVWWVLAGLIHTPETLHNARIVERVPIEGRQVRPPAPTIEEAFTTWRRAQPELRAGDHGNRPVPMLLVATQGGGIRAAVWTAYALDCIVAASPSPGKTCVDDRRSPRDRRRAGRRLFLASGVSGGAVGLQAYAQEMLADGMRERDWVEDRLGRDFAAPTVGWGLFHDLINHFVGIHPDEGDSCEGKRCLERDRAAVLEQAFDGERDATPLLRHTWDQRHDNRRHLRALAETVPLLVTNATVTNGTARAVVSAADLGSWPLGEPDTSEAGADAGRDTLPLAGTREVSDMLCQAHDLRLSTAAMLGARFPYVSPSGRLGPRCGKAGPGDSQTPCANSDETCETRLVDGGYVDNTGLLTIDALWPELRRLVVGHNRTSRRPIAPVIVELSNGYRPDREDLPVDAGATGSESLVPLTTSAGARKAVEAYARGRAYRIRPAGCTVTISPFLHPGITAPLGWTLSSHTRAELRDALVRPPPGSRAGDQNLPVEKLRRLQRWLEPHGAEDELVPLERCAPRG